MTKILSQLVYEVDQKCWNLLKRKYQNDSSVTLSLYIYIRGLTYQELKVIESELNKLKVAALDHYEIIKFIDEIRERLGGIEY